MAEDIARELDADIIAEFVKSLGIPTKEELARRALEKIRKQALVDKYLAGETTCQETEEAKDIIVEGI